MRFWMGTSIAAAFALGSYVAFLEGPGLVDRLLHPPEPVAHKVFVPPAKPTIVTVEPPIQQAVTPLQTAVIPGVSLPPASKPK